MQVCCLSLKSVFGWSINPKFYRYSGGSLVPCVCCTQKYLHSVITERAKSVKRKISAIVIKELLKSKKPSLIGMRDVVPWGRKSECRSMAVKGKPSAVSHLSLCCSTYLSMVRKTVCGEVRKSAAGSELSE